MRFKKTISSLLIFSFVCMTGLFPQFALNCQGRKMMMSWLVGHVAGLEHEHHPVDSEHAILDTERPGFDHSHRFPENPGEAQNYYGTPDLFLKPVRTAKIQWPVFVDFISLNVTSFFVLHSFQEIVTPQLAWRQTGRLQDLLQVYLL